MFIVCISASNIKHVKDNSTSIKACNIIKNIVMSKVPNADVQIIPLVNYELKPCIGCGKCFEKDCCMEDDEFNKIYNILIKADGMFIVSAHYAPIPAKLSMLLEKVEQFAFLKRFNDESYRSHLYQKPVGLVAHGGGTEAIMKYYKAPVLDSITNALSYPVEMNIVEADSNEPNGVIFPVRSVKCNKCSPFPMQEYDWNDIKKRLEPLISNVLNKIKK